MSDKDRVFIFDTTMRDGEQSPGASMSLEEKIQLARVFDELGIDKDTKDYLCIHCNHYRYADMDDDAPKLCDFCDTLCDTLDVGKCEEGNLNVCG